MNGKNVVLAGHDVGINLETRRGRQIPTSRRWPRPRIAMEAAKKTWGGFSAEIENRSLDLQLRGHGVRVPACLGRTDTRGAYAQRRRVSRG